MEYRGVQYTIVEDERGWQWSVVLDGPPKTKSGHALSKGTAILKVWAAIDRALARTSSGCSYPGDRPRLGFCGGTIPGFVLKSHSVAFALWELRMPRTGWTPSIVPKSALQ